MFIKLKESLCLADPRAILPSCRQHWAGNGEQGSWRMQLMALEHDRHTLYPHCLCCGNVPKAWLMKMSALLLYWGVKTKAGMWYQDSVLVMD